jgi:hypothetical protein
VISGSSSSSSPFPRVDVATAATFTLCLADYYCDAVVDTVDAGDLPTVQDCADACASYKYFDFAPVAGGGGFTCWCDNDCPVVTNAPGWSTYSIGSNQCVFSPTFVPTVPPTASPTAMPTVVPSAVPTVVDSTADPSAAPTPVLSFAPTASPTADPSAVPTRVPSVTPTTTPSHSPSVTLTVTPSISPSLVPTPIPSFLPTTTVIPTEAPTVAPSVGPTVAPTLVPSVAPSTIPSSVIPTFSPTVIPSDAPTAILPTVVPPHSPTVRPTATPTTTVISHSPTSSSSSSVPTVVPTSRTKASLTVNAEFTFSSVKGESLNPTSQETVKQSIANASLTTALNVDLVSIQRLDTNRRRLSLLRVEELAFHTLAATLVFNYKVVANIHFNLIDFPDSFNASYVAKMKSQQLVHSVESGVMKKIVHYYAVANNATQLLNTTATNVTVLSTAVTPAPISASDSDSSASSGLSGGQIAGLVVGVTGGAILLIALLYWMIIARKSGKESARENQAPLVDNNVEGADDDMLQQQVVRKNG